ncbi:unnamed protein product [Phytophthora fragariaefolia]|uniref:Unnamed protein product n=1 Tax=Phytophthora fragariaefolia TaxID=1490495 RepID=A0A9W6Y1H4_9STRA|nr:unnamed protein product [Phytophthora fragariaefolia]
MDEEFATPPRRHNPKRLQRKAESSPEVLEQQQRLKREMNLTRELIDFDLIKGCVCLAVVQTGSCAVSSALQAPDTEPACKILSPIIKQPTESVCSSESDTSHATSGLASGLAESENSDGTDSDEDSGNSSSSSDESNPNDDMFPHKSSSAPTSPKRVRLHTRRLHSARCNFASDISLVLQVMRSSIGKPPMSLPPRVPLNGGLERDSVVDQFARRRVTVCVWEDGFPVKRAMSITELRNTILAKVRIDTIVMCRP